MRVPALLVVSPLLAPLLASLLASVLACGKEETPDPTPSGPTTTELTLAGEARAQAPRFSPDGKTLAFIRNLPGQNARYELALISREGKDERLLTEAGSYLSSPAWAADGATLFFSGAEEVFQLPAAGGMPTSRLKEPGKTFAMRSLDLSRDGTRLAWGVNGGNVHLATLSTRAIEKQTYSGHSTRFSPDGTRLALVEGEKYVIYTLADQKRQELGEAGTYLATLAWFADGKRLAVTSRQGLELLTLNDDLTLKERKLLKDDFAATDLDVSPDGSTLAYIVNGQRAIFLLTGF